MRTACILEYLASRYSVDVITFRESGAPDPRDAFPPKIARSIFLLPLPKHTKRPWERALRNLRRAIQGAPPLVDRFSGHQLPVLGDYELGVIEHFWCAPYVAQLQLRCRRVVLDLHNIESVLLQRCAATENRAGNLLFSVFARSCKRMEELLLPQFDQLLVTSEADRELVGGVVYPNVIPYIPLPNRRRNFEVAFSGNMEYHPNTAAAHYFARAIWPILRARHPDLRWKLIGRNPHALSLPTDERIITTGPVDDAVGELATACAAVVPLLSGSGTRFKILEAWAAGTPVVSTSIGAEGLDANAGEHLLIADTPEEFATAVSNILSDETLAERISRAGRAFYEANFTWPVAWKMLELAEL